MPTLVRGMQFTENEWAYCLWHRGWRPAPVPTPAKAKSLWVRLALDTAESQRTSDSYLERKKNSAPGADGCVGYDIGISMYNERLNGQAAALPDAFVLFDWWEAAGATFHFANVLSPNDPFGPWLYPRAGVLPNRNDQTLDVAGIASRVGPNPYAIERSPYWKMKALGVEVHDLPVPPRELWVSPLPAAPMSQGQSGTQTSPLGIAINTLQRRLDYEGHWVDKNGNPAGAYNWYYGSDWVRSSIESKQRHLASLGLYGGPIDGRNYTVAFRTIWDGILRHAHELGVT